MKEYYEILKEIENKKLNITKLYIYSCVSTEIEENEHQKIVDYIYDTWLKIDQDICLARLCDIINDNWENIKNNEFNYDDIEIQLFN